MFPLPALKRVRLERFLSQQNLADEAGVTEATVNRIEHGQPARLSTIRKLAAALKVEPSELIKGESSEGREEAAA
jgi:transcriptional regulator with XRE-family HTH domain